MSNKTLRQVIAFRGKVVGKTDLHVNDRYIGDDDQGRPVYIICNECTYGHVLDSWPSRAIMPQCQKMRATVKRGGVMQAVKALANKQAVALHKKRTSSIEENTDDDDAPLVKLKGKAAVETDDELEDSEEAEEEEEEEEEEGEEEAEGEEDDTVEEVKVTQPKADKSLKRKGKVLTLWQFCSLLN